MGAVSVLKGALPPIKVHKIFSFPKCGAPVQTSHLYQSKYQFFVQIQESLPGIATRICDDTLPVNPSTEICPEFGIVVIALNLLHPVINSLTDIRFAALFQQSLQGGPVQKQSEIFAKGVRSRSVIAKKRPGGSTAAKKVILRTVYQGGSPGGYFSRGNTMAYERIAVFIDINGQAERMK